MKSKVKPSFTKAPTELVATFESTVPGPPAQTRKMFGYPAAFVNGNMFMGLFADQMFLRLPSEARDELAAQSGAGPFEPMPGRPMAEYTVLPESILTDRDELARWVKKSFDYGKSLKAKPSVKSSTASTKSRKPSGRK